MISPILKKRLIIFGKNNISLVIFFPYVIVHELCHYFFIRCLKEKFQSTFFVEINSLGFSWGADDVKLTYLEALYVILLPIAPLLLFIPYYIILLHNHHIPFLLNLYLAGGGIYLFPSSTDWSSFIGILKVIWNEE